MKDRSPLSELPRELKRATGETPKYRAIYAKVLDGDLPAEKINGRWTYSHEDLPIIAETLGLAIRTLRRTSHSSARSTA